METSLTLEAACAPYRSLAIAGTAKNAGKTTALNYLIDRFAQAGERIGVSSIGRDGEAVDQITNRPKPRIRPPVGALVATSHESALYSQATLKKVADTAFRTALGPVGIYRVEHPGYVEVAGPVKVKEAAALLRQLADLGCTKILLDGAADRRAFLSAGVDGFVLATGLVLSSDPAEVLALTRDVLNRFELPTPPELWQIRLSGKTLPGALLTSGQFVPWINETFLAGLEGFADWWPEQAEVLYVPGAMTDSLAEVLLKSKWSLSIVVPSGTHLLVSQPLIERLIGRGYQFFAQRPVNAVAITLNPTSPTGETIDPRTLLDVFWKAFPTMPVVDVLAD